MSAVVFTVIVAVIVTFIFAVIIAVIIMSNFRIRLRQWVCAGLSSSDINDTVTNFHNFCFNSV